MSFKTFLVACVALFVVASTVYLTSKVEFNADISGIKRSPARMVGDVWYSQDPRTGICFALTAPNMTYGTTSPVECTPAVLKAVEDDRDYLEGKI